MRACRRSSSPPKTYYVDATGGSDSVPGNSTPWQTIAKVNAQTFKPGDRILFKCGETWSATSLIPPSSGKMGKPIFFGAYGSGANPIINKSTDDSVKVTSRNNLIFDRLDGTLGVHNYNVTDSYNILIQNASVTHATQDSTSIAITSTNDYDSHHVTVRKCTITGVPGWGVSSAANIVASLAVMECIINNIAGGGTVEHHGLYFKANTDLLVDRCSINSPDHNCIKIAQTAGKAMTGMIKNCMLNAMGAGGVSGAGIEISGVTVGGLTIQNNIFKDSTSAQGIITDGSASGGITLYHNKFVRTRTGIFLMAGCSGWVIKNNLFMQDFAWLANANKPCIECASDTEISANTYDNNLYWFKNGGGSLPPLRSGGSNLTFVQWKAKTGSPDVHGVSADPVFVANYTDLHLQTTSPAKNAGATGLGVVDDYEGNLRDATPDIGAYEFI